MRTTTHFAIALITATFSVSAQNDVMTNGAFSYGSGHGSFATGHRSAQPAGTFHKNPWQHTVVHHKTANEYQKDPWIARNSIANKDDTRDGWYSPYQQFSPPQLQYKPSVAEATFATCRLVGRESDPFNGIGDHIQFAQMKGKAVVVKRNFCSSDRWNGMTGGLREWYNRIMEFGRVDVSNTGVAVCTDLGDEFNPLQEVDKFGRKNPFQDPNRARGIASGTAGDSSGFEDLEPFSLLHNLDGAESIMGRSVVVILVADTTNVKSCCIIAREEAPEGFGPKPVPFPLTTMSRTYNSYGSNYAVPLPYHKHGYQATGDVDVMAGNTNYAAALVDQYLF